MHANTVRAWTDQGRLRCLRINSRGDRRYSMADLTRFLADAGADSATPAPVGTESAGPTVDAVRILRRVAEECAGHAELSDALSGVATLLAEAGYDSALLVAGDGASRPTPGRRPSSVNAVGCPRPTDAATNCCAETDDTCASGWSDCHLCG